MEEEAPLASQSEARRSWLTLQGEAAPPGAMSQQVLGEEPPSNSGLCHYAQKMTACFGHLGKEIKDVHEDFFFFLVSVM